MTGLGLLDGILSRQRILAVAPSPIAFPSPIAPGLRVLGTVIGTEAKSQVRSLVLGQDTIQTHTIRLENFAIKGDLSLAKFNVPITFLSDRLRSPMSWRVNVGFSDQFRSVGDSRDRGKQQKSVSVNPNTTSQVPFSFSFSPPLEPPIAVSITVGSGEVLGPVVGVVQQL